MKDIIISIHRVWNSLVVGSLEALPATTCTLFFDALGFGTVFVFYSLGAGLFISIHYWRKVQPYIS
jgi:hypothetical protein